MPVCAFAPTAVEVSLGALSALLFEIIVT